MHIILPEERIGFFTSNSVQNFKCIAFKNINTSRFVNKDIISAHKQRLVFNRRVSAEMLSEAIKLLEKAKNVHDDLEADYIKAMNFDKLNEFTDKLIDGIL